MTNPDNRNNENLPLLQQQDKFLSQTNAENWLFSKYPLITQRKAPIISLAHAIGDSLSLVSIDKRCGEALTLKWIKAQLLDVFRACGAGGVVSSYQVVTIARRIRGVYFYLSLSELTYFFEAFIGGCYGALYVGKTVNPQNIMTALAAFDTDRANRITDVECEVNNAHKIEAFTPASQDFINRICKRIKDRLNKSNKQ